MNEHKSVISATERYLSIQGFNCAPDSGIDDIKNGLRFTPTLNAIWIFLATLFYSPGALWAFTFIALAGVIQGRHLFDYLYNVGVILIGRKDTLLPINPRPRLFAMFLAAIWSAFAALLMMSGLETLGAASGLGLTAVATIAATTHFCVGSVIYRILEWYKIKLS